MGMICGGEHKHQAKQRDRGRQRRQALRNPAQDKTHEGKPMRPGQKCFKCRSTDHGVLICPKRSADEARQGIYYWIKKNRAERKKKGKGQAKGARAAKKTADSASPAIANRDQDQSRGANYFDRRGQPLQRGFLRRATRGDDIVFLPKTEHDQCQQVEHTAHADGEALICGQPCSYIIDDGSNNATINRHFADAHITLLRHKRPIRASLADLTTIELEHCRVARPKSRHCSVCEKADRHDTEQCQYRRGGPWYGLTGEALQVAKDTLYRDLKPPGRRQPRNCCYSFI